MELVAPSGPVYQAGTLSGNPLAMTAGIETLKVLAQPEVYEALEKKAALLEAGLKSAAAEAGVPVYSVRAGSMMTLFFTDRQVIDYDSARTSDTARYRVYFHHMLESGVYLAPSQFEAAFLSLAHTDEDIELTLKAAERALRQVKGL